MQWQHRVSWALCAALSLAWAAAEQPVPLPGQEAVIRIKTRDAGHRVSPFLTGACVEDVNHEIYGGIYSQMLFGESFQEPPISHPIRGFAAADGEWTLGDGEVSSSAGRGPKLISALPAFFDGEVGVDVWLPQAPTGGVHNGGLIVNVNRAGAGADNFDGYEISLDAGRKVVSLGRHRHDWRLLAEAKAEIAPDRWAALAARLTGNTIQIRVDGKTLIEYQDRDHPLAAGSIGLRSWQCAARYRKLWVDRGAGRVDLPFAADPDADVAISRMWRAIRTGSAVLHAGIETSEPFVGVRSQRIEHAGGNGEVGIENQGLNRWGLSLEGGKPYEGYLWARAPGPVELFVSLENQDGTRIYAQAQLAIKAAQWTRYDFALTPARTDQNARFAIRLRSPGTVMVGHALLQPGSWGRFNNLPLRRDVVEALQDQGISVLRYGGSMVNASEYRWKKMIGPRDRRPPYRGTWYPWASNGWGILDFLDLCEAAGFEGIPDFNINETPQDMADFIEYINAGPQSEWGRRRISDGHPEPYNLKYIELGNEERVDGAYLRKFTALADAIWAKDPNIILVVGDFAYHRPIIDPMKLGGADSGITSLSAHRSILQLAKSRNREVWFDVHVGTEGPGASDDLDALPTYIDALGRLADGARHRVVVFEFNANHHDQRRALGNALAVGRVERDGRIPIATSANGLQPDKQNDNGWDQGLLFLNPSRTWLQPPGYVTRMIARSRLPLTVPAETQGAPFLDVTAQKSQDGRRLCVRVVNFGQVPVTARLEFDGFSAQKATATAMTLAGDLTAANTAEKPQAIVPRPSQFTLGQGHPTRYTFPPHSFSVLQIE